MADTKHLEWARAQMFESAECAGWSNKKNRIWNGRYMRHGAKGDTVAEIVAMECRGFEAYEWNEIATKANGRAIREQLAMRTDCAAAPGT